MCVGGCGWCGVGVGVGWGGGVCVGVFVGVWVCVLVGVGRCLCRVRVDVYEVGCWASRYGRFSIRRQRRVGIRDGCGGGRRLSC